MSDFTVHESRELILSNSELKAVIRLETDRDPAITIININPATGSNNKQINLLREQIPDLIRLLNRTHKLVL